MGKFKNTYAFDDSSILKLCTISIRGAYQIYFTKRILNARNYPQLKSLIDQLTRYGYSKFRFVPAENIEDNIIKVANQLLEGYNIQKLWGVFKN